MKRVAKCKPSHKWKEIRKNSSLPKPCAPALFEPFPFLLFLHTPRRRTSLSQLCAALYSLLLLPFSIFDALSGLWPQALQGISCTFRPSLCRPPLGPRLGLVTCCSSRHTTSSNPTERDRENKRRRRMGRTFCAAAP